MKDDSVVALGNLGALVRRGLVTTNLAERDSCCGQSRDDDGFCQHREYHPVYVEPLYATATR